MTTTSTYKSLNQQSPSAYDNDFIGLGNEYAPIRQFYGYTAPSVDQRTTSEQKNKQAEEAMKQFNLFSFPRAAPGVLFGRGDPGFESPSMKAKRMGFQNVYDSLFGQAPAVQALEVSKSFASGNIF